MKFEHVLNEYRKDPERQIGGYKALATRLSKDLGKRITWRMVKDYLDKKKRELKNTKVGRGSAWRYFIKNAEKATDPGAYLYGHGGAIYNILKGHFS